MLIQSFLYEGNYYDGILCNNKGNVTIDCRSHKWHNAIGTVGKKEQLICNNQNFDVYPYEFNESGVYIDFLLNNMYIQPTAFMIRGRLEAEPHNLKNWRIYGLNPYYYSNHLLYEEVFEIKKSTNYIFNLTNLTRKRYSGIRIQNMGLDTFGIGCYHLCISSFEVFGYVYDGMEKITSNRSALTKFWNIFKALIILLSK